MQKTHCMLFGSSPIPKEFRAPRPTALPVGRRTMLGRVPALELGMLLLAVVLFALRPLQAADDWLTDALLQTLARASPSTTTTVVRIEPSTSALRDCGEALQRGAGLSGLRALILTAPASSLCASTGSAHTPSYALPEGVLRRGIGQRVIGWRASAEQRLLPLRKEGLRFGRWALPRGPTATPSVQLTHLLDGRVPAGSLDGRVAVVEIASETTAAARQTANLIAASLEGEERNEAPPWFSALLALTIASLLVLAERRGAVWLLAAAASSVPVAIALCYAGLLLHPLGVLPTAHLLLLGPVIALALRAPRGFANRRAIAHAADLMERAALMRSDGLHTIADEDFWPRVGDLAMQAHPADSVLVAELPPQEWHLRFWPYRGMGENVVKERRRDIRRTPYSNEEGTPEINVTRRFLVMEGTPAVVIPLIALGEIEGYVFLCGDTAERAYLRAPETAQRLSQDLGLMLRRRRVGKAGERKWRRADGNSGRGPAFDTAQLVEGAELALGDLRMFNTLLRNAPVGLLYADAFGHVRVLGSAFGEWLSDRGVAVPPGAVSAPLLPGALMLGAILEALRDEDGHAVSLAEVSERPEGARFEVPLSGRDGQKGRMTVFTLRALVETADGVSWTAGFVGSLTESPMFQEASEGQALRLPLDGGMDTLGVEPLAEQVRAAVRAAAAASGRPVQFEPPRDMGHAIAYHRELSDALTDLLYDAALKDAGGNGPVVTMEQGSDSVSIHILDVLFGLPSSALKRTLLAPSDPPQGLEAFGRFVRTVAESHGRVEIEEDEWGIRLTAHLLRARPLVRRPSLRPPAGRQRRDANSA